MNCKHKFVFLRQERKNTGFDRNPVWVIEDVYHCERCLEYRCKAVEKRYPRTDSFEERVEKLV